MLFKRFKQQSMSRIDGFKFWKDLGAPKFVLAPMVDQSELPWRMLSKKYGAQVKKKISLNTFSSASKLQY